MAPYRWQVAEEVAGPEEPGHPERSSRQAEAEKSRVVHGPDPRHERRESPHDRNEPGQHDRLAPMVLEERLGPLQVFPPEEPGVHGEGPGPDVAPDPVVQVVS